MQRCAAKAGFEHTCKVAQITEADLAGCFGNRHIGLRQQKLCLAKTELAEILLKAGIEVVAEQAAEIALAVRKCSGGRAGRNFVRILFSQKIKHLDTEILVGVFFRSREQKAALLQPSKQHLQSSADDHFPGGAILAALLVNLLYKGKQFPAEIGSVRDNPFNVRVTRFQASFQLPVVQN